MDVKEMKLENLKKALMETKDWHDLTVATYQHHMAAMLDKLFAAFEADTPELTHEQRQELLHKYPQQKVVHTWPSAQTFEQLVMDSEGKLEAFFKEQMDNLQLVKIDMHLQPTVDLTIKMTEDASNGPKSCDTCMEEKSKNA